MAKVDSHGELAKAVEMLKSKIEQLKQECTEFSFMVAGKTGVGKSTLLNALTGTKMFPTSSSRSEAGTKTVKQYTEVKNGVTITAWDTPGFENSSEIDARYTDEIRRKCSNVDLILYCISLKHTRFNLEDDKNAFRRITEALTVDAWKKAVVVLTYANKLQDRIEDDLGEAQPSEVEKQFSETTKMWKKGVLESLQNAGVKHASSVPVIPAGYVKAGPHLPGQRYWLSNLWLTIFNAVIHNNVTARLAFSRLSEGRFKKEGEETKGTDIILEAANLGIGIGGMIGAIVLGVPTIGLASVVGVISGGAIGGGVGLTIGVIMAAVELVKSKLSKEKKP